MTTDNTPIPEMPNPLPRMIPSASKRVDDCRGEDPRTGRIVIARVRVIGAVNKAFADGHQAGLAAKDSAVQEARRAAIEECLACVTIPVNGTRTAKLLSIASCIRALLYRDNDDTPEGEPDECDGIAWDKIPPVVRAERERIRKEMADEDIVRRMSNLYTNTKAGSTASMQAVLRALSDHLADDKRG